MLLCPRNFPGKNIGAGCHSLLQEIFPNWMETDSPASPTVAGGFFTPEPPGKPGELKYQKCLLDLEMYPGSGCWQGHFPPDGTRTGPVADLSPALGTSLDGGNLPPGFPGCSSCVHLSISPL